MKLKNLIILSSIIFFLGAGNPESGKEKVAVCSACHGSDGNSVVGLWPSLAGQNEKYLVKQLRLVKSGDRVIDSMVGLLDNLQDSDLQDIAAFYASQKNKVGQADESKVELIDPITLFVFGKDHPVPEGLLKPNQKVQFPK